MQFLPLYKQVHDELVNRLVKGYWKPAESLPSEFALADELGVSQGTVRKALNQLVDENLLRRHQGKGTYVSEHTQESSLFRFFRYRRSNGEPVIPVTEVLKVSRRKAKSLERKRLGLSAHELVVQMTRMRSIDKQPAIFEKVIQPLRFFPDIDKEQELPNSLYTLYQLKYGISIVEVQDELNATILDKTAAKYLNLDTGQAVLENHRSSINIDGRVVEWSTAICHPDFVYAVSLK